MSILDHFSIEQRIIMEEHFIAQSTRHEIDLQQPKEGEGFWLTTVQEEYEQWVLHVAVMALTENKS